MAMSQGKRHDKTRHGTYALVLTSGSSQWYGIIITSPVPETSLLRLYPYCNPQRCETERTPNNQCLKTTKNAWRSRLKNVTSTPCPKCTPASRFYPAVPLHFQSTKYIHWLIDMYYQHVAINLVVATTKAKPAAGPPCLSSRWSSREPRVVVSRSPRLPSPLWSNTSLARVKLPIKPARLCPLLLRLSPP